MLFLLLGEEAFLVWQKMQELKRDFQKKYPEATVAVFDLEEDEGEKVVENWQQGSGLFAAKKMFIIKNAGEMSTPEQRVLASYLENNYRSLRRDFLIVFAELKGKKNFPQTKLGIFLKKHAQIKEFSRKTGRLLEQWVGGEFLRRSGQKVTIELLAMRELIKRADGNLWLLSNEIDKLIAYQMVGEIKLPTVQQLCPAEPTAGIFELVDAIGQEDKAKALRIKRRLLEQGENEFYLLSMILFQIKNIIKVKECRQAGYRLPPEIKQQTGLHPFVIAKTMKILNRFPEERIKKIYRLAANLDWRSKTESSKQKMAEMLDLFIVQI